MKQYAQQLLAWFSEKILQKYNPKIIGITGSVGKTSAKEAIFSVVSKRYRAYRPLKNFNNEFGLPFAILGVDTPGRSVRKWIALVVKSVGLLLFTQKYPEVLVLEYGIDRTGDMDYLLSIARPDIAVLTTIGVAHYEFFKDIESIQREKGKLLHAVPADGTVIINADNESALALRTTVNAQVMTYGVKNTEADVQLSNIHESYDKEIQILFTVKSSSTVSGEMKVNAVGETHVSAIAAAIAVGIVMNVDSESMRQGVLAYKPAPSRLNVIGGIKRATLIDDSYNASPDSMQEALALFNRIPNADKIAVLGDMLELGTLTDEVHALVGKQIAAMQISHLVTVGPNGKTIARAAREASMDENSILSFDNSDEAKRVVQQLLKPSGLVLIKGSQGVRMEKITVEIMAEPMRARELVCRQSGSWVA